MENLYSITVANKFSLAIDEDEDPLELLKIREQEREAKKKEKLSEKENKSKQPESVKTAGSIKQQQKPRVIKENQQATIPKVQDAKKDNVEKKPAQQRTGGGGGDRNVKFSGESREERNNRRNREDGDRPQRNHDGQVKRGPPGEGRDFRNSGDGPRGDFGDRRGLRGPPRGQDRADRGERGDRQDRAERQERGDRYDRQDRTDRQDRGDRQDRFDRAHQDRPERSSGGGPRGERGARGGGRGGRTGFDSRGKREFDRQSGSDKTHGYSGVKPVDKKDGAGSHNWGTHNDEIEESMNPESQDSWGADKPEGEVKAASAEVKEGEAPAEVKEGETPAEEVPVDEEAKKLTLDEYRALRGQRAKPTFNLRKAGEGEDLTRWQKMYALEKKKEAAEEEEEEEEEKYDATVEYPQRVGRQKHVRDIEIQFSDSRRGGGGRGGRPGRGPRGDRPNGGRGGYQRDGGNRPPRGQRDDAPRGDATETRGSTDAPKAAPAQVEQRSPRGVGRQNAPKVDDEHDFPSLG